MGLRGGMGLGGGVRVAWDGLGVGCSKEQCLH